MVLRDPSVGLLGEVSLAEGLLYKKERLEALLAKDFSLGLISFFGVRLIGVDRLQVLTVCCCLREVSVLGSSSTSPLALGLC